jgi:hypothetical protein
MGSREGRVKGESVKSLRSQTMLASSVSKALWIALLTISTSPLRLLPAATPPFVVEAALSPKPSSSSHFFQFCRLDAEAVDEFEEPGGADEKGEVLGVEGDRTGGVPEKREDRERAVVGMRVWERRWAVWGPE